MLLCEQLHPERERSIAGCVAVFLLAFAPGAATAQTPPVATLDRLVITGSHIPRPDMEGAFPVQVITREEIERSGVTTVEQLLERVPANVNGVNLALTIGSSNRPGLSGANLRGLGGGSTLVLLNGRRLGNYAFDGETVDLNSIPLAAIDRVEVLKDGASAIYGTDAIAGVINFILRKDYQGAEISGSFSATQHGGGNSGQINASYGFGDPAHDGYNIFATASYQKQQSLRAVDREFARTANRPEEGIDGLTPVTFPANINDRARGRLINPTFAAGCAPPASLPFPRDPTFVAACGYDTAVDTDLLPEVERASAMMRGTWRANSGVDVFGEALIGRTRVDPRVAPTPVPGITLFGRDIYPDDGPYYPSAFAAANGLSGNLLVLYRAVELGPRTNSTISDTQRFALGAEGTLAGWDFNVAAVYNGNRQENEYVSGYLYVSRLIPAMATGLINPFGPSAPEGAALLASTAYSGTPQTAHGSTSLINAFASREIASLPAGPLALALGTEARREKLSYDWDPSLVSGDPFLGADPRPISGNRNVAALFAEVNVPIVRGLDAQLAVRYDDYSDFGTTTNPKVALRWQPVPTLLLRGSWGTGFRAPPLYSLHEPLSSGLTPGFEDPIRCPVTGAVEDCRFPVETIGGGNPNLEPETSTQWNFGIVWEPTRGLSLGVDYWNIEQKGVISSLDVENVLRYYDKFSDRVIRGPADPASPKLPGSVVAIDTSLLNLGTTNTSGIDVSFNWRSTLTEVGVFRVGLEGTYVQQWETQIDGVTFVSLLSDAKYGAPIPRWRSALTVDWTHGYWGATIAHLYSSGYTDQNPGIDTMPRKVDAYATWDLQGRYSGFAGWQLAAGIRNLFDTDPPFSNQFGTFQVGFNPQVASPLGRVFYLRAGYAFK